jgi:LPS-assembly lipoprotein
MKIIPFLSLLLLTSCGFQPVYGDLSHNPATASALSNVAIANIPNRDGQALRNHLIDRMYGKARPQSPTTKLEISLHSYTINLGLQKDATTTRQEYNLTASYVLKNNDGKILLSGDVRSIVSYNKLEAQYATVAAQQSAIDRAIAEVGEQIVNRISLYLSETS